MTSNSNDRFFTELCNPVAPEYLRSRNPMYERKPVTDLWIALTRVAEFQLKWKAVPDANKNDMKWLGRKNRLFLVSGPPGNGKSSAVYAWAQKTCLSSGYNVAWIDVANKGDGSSKSFRRNEEVTAVITEQIAPDFEFDIVIFDGVRVKALEKWEGRFKELARLGVVVIIVSSESIRLHGGDMNDITELDHRFPSWTMDEYEHAAAYDAFWRGVAGGAFGPDHIDDDVDARKVALKEKFPLAGHSARFMFRLSGSEVKQKIDKSSTALETIESLGHAIRSQGNTGAVNTLMAWLHDNGITTTQNARILDNTVPPATTFDEFLVTPQEFQITPVQHRNCLVSSYAARKVIESIEPDVNHLRKAAKTMGVRALEGYALEAHFQRTLNNAAQTASNITVYDKNGIPENWNVVSYRLAGDVFSELLQNQSAGTWIWVGGYQAGFDAVHIYGDGRIRFVQMTAGQKHDYLFSAIDSLLRRLALADINFTHVDFVVVRPQDDSRIFTNGNVTGRLGQGWKDFSDSKWDLTDPTCNSRMMKIAWSI